MTTKFIRAIGKKEYEKHLKGQRLTYKEMLAAGCFSCMGFYIDGKHSCEIEMCPAFPAMPYRNIK
jgi:hypothetical protein|tara:strand:- start:201 stop:395 length:195 start_codon:yes stop_codon:yes gene_type:complete